jgi:hypothetical protein
VTANKELLANCGAELCSRRLPRPGWTSSSRRRWPGASPHPAPEGVAGRRADPSDHGHRQRHHQLHPDPDERIDASYHDALAEAQSLGYAERDPTADVEGLRRRGQGGHPGQRGLRCPSGRRRRVPRRHQRYHPGGHRGRPSTGLQSSCWPSSNAPAGRRVPPQTGPGGAAGVRRRSRVAVRVHPAMVPLDPPAGCGPGLLQRGVRGGRCRRRAHVPRARGRRDADGQRRSRRPARRGPQSDDGRGGPQRDPCGASRSRPSTTCGPPTT